MAYDAARKQAVLFGGAGGGGSSSALGDTWIWDGASWSQVQIAVAPLPRTLHTMVYDAARGKVLLFGGARGVDEFGAVLGDTWTWDGTSWTELSPANAPSPRAAHETVYDDARATVLLFGGYSLGELDDTWSWDGTTWTELHPTSSPSARELPAMAFDVPLGRTVLFGGRASGSDFGDTWTWDGKAWTQLSPKTSPSARSRDAMVYDVARGDIVLFGGYNAAFEEIGETWLFHIRGGACSTGADCDSGNCTDGVCCESASCGTCSACNLPSNPGICTPVTNAPDPDSCMGTNACDGSGTCKPIAGRACASGSDCASGFCTDGVCCNEACGAQCEACDIAGAVGKCSPTSGAPHGSRAPCAGAPPGNVCGALACNGVVTAACVGFVGSETVCKAASCVDGKATLVTSCAGNGVCPEPVTMACAPFACGGETCAKSCSSDADCATMFHCVAASGTCVANAAASCDGMHTVTSPDGHMTDCAPYTCEGTSCKTSCQSVVDCVYPAECTGEGKCATSEPTPTSSSGGCRAAPSAHGDPPLDVLCFLATALGLRSRRRRSSER
jgi:hypothetical protein